MRILNNTRIGVKTQIATVTIVLLFAVVAISVAVLRLMLTDQAGHTVLSAGAVNSINAVSGKIGQYLEGALAYGDLAKAYAAFEQDFSGRYANEITLQVSLRGRPLSIEEYLDGVWQDVARAESLAKQNRGTEAEVIALTDECISKSNEFLTSISQRLADTVRQKDVTVLERLVIVGATANTNANYTIQLLFKDMKADLSRKDDLLGYLDAAEKNAVEDSARLAKTAFAGLPVAALAAIRKTKELAARYIDDVVEHTTIRDGATTALADLAASISEAQGADIQGSFSKILAIMNVLLYSFAGLVLLVIAVQILVSRSITRPIRHGVQVMRDLEQGNFTVAAEVSGRDESGRMLSSMNAMIERVRHALGTVQSSSERVASSSSEIWSSAQRLAEGAQSQASTLEQTSASVEELTASVEQVAEHAQSQVTAIAQGTASMAQVQTSIEEAAGNLTRISDLADQSVANAVEGAGAVEQVVKGINLISGSSERIGGIVQVISEIADQTHLLALNASIEAARAGEHGRGFAVVADEVSKLAERSASSAKEIESLIRESAKNVTAGVKTAEGSQAAMERIREASQKVRDMIASLAAAMKQQVIAIRDLGTALVSINDMSSSISAATEEQSANARQVSKAVENVNELTQSAASAAEQMSAATEQLSTMAQELQGLAGQFRIDQAPGAPTMDTREPPRPQALGQRAA